MLIRQITYDRAWPFARAAVIPGCQRAACMCAQVLAELGAIKRVLSRDLKTSGRSSSRPDSPAHPPVMRQLPTPFQVEAPAE